MAKKINLPANVEAERTVLGSMILSPNACSLGLASLTPESFSGVDKRNVLVFQAIQALVAHKTPVDASTLTDQLINFNTLEDAGGPEYILELTNSPISPDNIDHYINIVHDQALLRDYLLQMDKIRGEYARGEVPDIGDFLTQSTLALEEIASQRTVGEFKKADTVSETVRAQIENQSARGNRGLTGVDTGYPRLNRITHGWQKGDLVVIASRPSVGKTAFAINLALHATSYKDKPVAFFSCEMGADQIMKRLIALVGRIDSERIQTGDLSERETIKINSAIATIKNLKLYIDDTANPNLGDLLAKAHKLKAAEPDLAAIFIDYLNLIETGEHNKNDSRAQEVSQITRSLKELARNLHVPVIALAQLNRDVEKNEGNVPSLSNLKESGSIEQDADLVLLMYRPDYYTIMGHKDVKPKGFGNTEYAKTLSSQVQEAQKAGNPQANDISVVSILVAKNRNGRTEPITLMFSRNYSLFESATLELEQQQAKTLGLALGPLEDA